MHFWLWPRIHRSCMRQPWAVIWGVRRSPMGTQIKRALLRIQDINIYLWIRPVIRLWRWMSQQLSAKKVCPICDYSEITATQHWKRGRDRDRESHTEREEWLGLERWLKWYSTSLTSMKFKHYSHPKDTNQKQFAFLLKEHYQVEYRKH
jgi:hypothetical protein